MENNFVGKKEGENAGYQYFQLFLQCLQYLAVHVLWLAKG